MECAELHAGVGTRFACRRIKTKEKKNKKENKRKTLFGEKFSTPWMGHPIMMAMQINGSKMRWNDVKVEEGVAMMALNIFLLFACS